ncbi:hypothetical protein IGJ18_001638 [Enterococcus sp. AZ078]
MTLLRKYNVITMDIELDGKLNTKELSGTEIHLLSNRDVVYVYVGEKKYYIGQTKNLLRRHQQHNSSSNKNFVMKNYDRLIVIYGKLIDKNLDYLEKRLITLFVTDNEKRKKQVVIDNRTMGNNSNYYQDVKELESLVVCPLWEEELTRLGVTNNTKISTLKQKILAKYSPFMDLTDQQQAIIEQITSNRNNYIIEGGSGTGKTVLMTNLVAQIFDKFNGTKKIGVVIKANWRENAKKIFKDYGINKNVQVGTWGSLLTSEQYFDYIIVDEAHRLPRFYGKLHPSELKYFNNKKDKNSLELLRECTSSLVLFYDRYQTIRPSDIPVYTYDNYILNNKFKKIVLKTQFRINIHDEGKTYTSDDYLKGIKYALQISNDNSFDHSLFRNNDKDSYFGFVNSISELFDYIERMDNLLQDSQNRVIAGYAREWLSKKDKDAYDWFEGDKKWHWNSTHENWINKKNSCEEIGSIHAVQGIDINCVGLIIGKDLTISNDKIIGLKDNYYDRNGKPIQEEYTEEQFTEFIKNIYYTLMTRGIDGIRIFIEDEKLRNYFISVLS